MSLQIELLSKFKLNKMDPPVSTRLIKALIIEELERDKPEVAKK